jgi:uncharacterized protein YdhG (YjbR/CyaY superfamily)
LEFGAWDFKTLIMITKETKITNIDEYIACFPEHVQQLLSQIRSIVREVAPEAEEVISYQMPAFKYHGILVYFAAFKNHIGFFPTASGVEVFREELSAYKLSKGTIQLPLDKPLPLDLITRIVKFRKQENAGKAAMKRKNK